MGVGVSSSICSSSSSRLISFRRGSSSLLLISLYCRSNITKRLKYVFRCVSAPTWIKD